MKKLFNKLKTDAKFATAGEGHKLTEDTRTYVPSTSQQHQPNVRKRPMSASQVQAATAAIARHEQKANQTKTVVPKVMKTSTVKTEPHSSDQLVETKAPESNKLHFEDQIMFYSPFTKEVLKKSALSDHIREHLLMRLQTDAVESSVLMIRMLNPSKEKRQMAINTLNKYLDNIITHPDDEKYRKIRRSNRVFDEKVASIQGCEEFLEACGFKRTLDGTDEVFFVLDSPDIDVLKHNKELLSCVEPLPLELCRDAKISTPNTLQSAVERLPDEFFTLTTSEMKREQHSRSNEMNQSLQLRTRAMREAGRNTPNYKYTLIRVKFPDGKLLQGTFRASEKVEDLMTFIRSHINVNWAVFTLRISTGEDVDNENSSLSEAKLVPTAILNLTWNEEIQSQVREQQGIDLSLVIP